jgi:hypothetical protein
VGGACAPARVRGGCARRADRVRGEGAAHTVLTRWRKSYLVTNDMMFSTYDRFSGINSKKLFFHAVDYRVRSLFEEGRNEFLHLVAMLLGRLFLGMLD